MDDPLTITQSRFGVRLRFEFSTDDLIFTWRDNSGERSFRVPYEVIGYKTPSSLVWNNRAFAWRLRLIPLAGFFVSLGLKSGISGPLCALCGFIFAALLACGYFNVFAVRFLLLALSPPPPGASGHPLRVIDDSKGESILGEIARRWRDRMRALHATPNLDNDARNEVAKFNWLRDNGVIDDIEYQRAEDAINAANAHRLPPQGNIILN